MKDNILQRNNKSLSKRYMDWDYDHRYIYYSLNNLGAIRSDVKILFKLDYRI